LTVELKNLRKNVTDGVYSIIGNLNKLNGQLAYDQGYQQNSLGLETTTAVSSVQNNSMVFGFIVPNTKVDFLPIKESRTNLINPNIEQQGLIKDSKLSPTIMKKGNLTDQSSDDPMRFIGRNIAIDVNRRTEYSNKQVKEIKDQLDYIASIPPLVLIVNPNNFTKKHEQTVDYAKGRRFNITSMWIEKPLAISTSGKTSAQYVYKQGSGGGLTNANRIASVSYENLMSLVAIYRNNGMVYTDGLGDESNRGVPVFPISTYLFFDGNIYVGSFDDFSISDDANTPYNLNYSFNFTVRYQF
jgi:hypothetical protein